MSNYEPGQDPNNLAGSVPRPPGPRPQLATVQGPPRPAQPGGPVPQRPPILNPAQPPQNFRPPLPNTLQPQPRPIPPGQINNIPPGVPLQRPVNPIPGQLPPQRPPQQQVYPGQQPPPQFTGPQPQQGQLGPRGPPPRNQAPPYPNSTPQSRPPAPPLGQTSRQGSLAAINPQLIPNPQIPMDSEAIAAAVKNRSYSIAGPPGPLPTGPLHDEERRRSIASALGGRPDEPLAQKPGLAFIKEGVASFDKKESPLNVGLTRLLSKEDVTRGSRESVKADSPDIRPESRLSGSKMTESIMGSLDTDDRRNFSPKPSPSPNGMRNEDDINRPYAASPQQNGVQMKNYENGHSPIPTFDRSPSLTRTDSSPDQKLPPPKNEMPIRPPSVLSKTPDDLNKGRQEDLERPGSRAGNKPTDFATPITGGTTDKRAVVKRVPSAQKMREGDNDSGVDESTQGNDHMNGSPGSPGKKSPSKIPGLKNLTQTPQSAGSRVVRSPSGKTPHTPNTPDSTTSNTSLDKQGKKVPMNQIEVGAAPSPNIKGVKSKIGSLENATHKPGGGRVKIENRKLEFANVTPRIAAKNDAYIPGGGDKKIQQKKLQWNAKSKIGSLENTSHRPGGGDKKIESVKLDFKEKAKPKVASTINLGHKPGGGDVKIENQKLDIKAQSKIGSLDNVKHKPGGGDKKIFEDKEYLKQIAGMTSHSTCEGLYDYLSFQDMEYDKDSGPRSIMATSMMTSRRSNDRPQRPRTARDPVRSRYVSPRKCQTPRNESAGMERPPFRCY